MITASHNVNVNWIRSSRTLPMVYMSDQNFFLRSEQIRCRQQQHSSFSPRKLLLCLVSFYACPSLSQRQEFGISLVFWIASGGNEWFYAGNSACTKFTYVLASNFSAGSQGCQACGRLFVFEVSTSLFCTFSSFSVFPTSSLVAWVAEKKDLINKFSVNW